MNNDNSNKGIQDEIRFLYNGSGKKPANVAKEHPRLYSRARKIFGSWKKALEACGIDYEKARNRNTWSRKKIIKEIRKLHKNEHSLRPTHLRNNGMVSLLSAANYHFGSWRQAVKKSGLPYPFGGGNNKKRKDTSTSQQQD